MVVRIGYIGIYGWLLVTDGLKPESSDE